MNQKYIIGKENKKDMDPLTFFTLGDTGVKM